eukprot:1309213-Amphidinium_carterae.1
MVRNAPSNSGWNWSEGDPECLNLDTLPLTPISELTMHKEPYEDPIPYPIAVTIWAAPCPQLQSLQRL